MRAFGFALLLAGGVLALGDYVVTNGANPPGALGQVITNVDDLNGALAGVAPYLGVGSLLALAGVVVMVTA